MNFPVRINVSAGMSDVVGTDKEGLNAFVFSFDVLEAAKAKELECLIKVDALIEERAKEKNYKRKIIRYNYIHSDGPETTFGKECKPLQITSNPSNIITGLSQEDLAAKFKQILDIAMSTASTRVEFLFYIGNDEEYDMSNVDEKKITIKEIKINP